MYYISKNIFKNPTAAILISLLVSQLIVKFSIPRMYPCFLFGILIHENIHLIKKYSGKITLWSGLLFIASLTIWDASFWDIPKPKDIINSFPDITLIRVYLYKNAFRLYIGLVGTIFFIALFEFLSEKLTFPEKSKFLCKYGAETLGIYVLQTFILEIAMKRYLNFDGYNFYLFNFVIAPALSLVTLMLCLGIIHMIMKSTLLSFLLLGKQMKNIGGTVKNHPK